MYSLIVHFGITKIRIKLDHLYTFGTFVPFISKQHTIPSIGSRQISIPNVSPNLADAHLVWLLRSRIIAVIDCTYVHSLESFLQHFVSHETHISAHIEFQKECIIIPANDKKWPCFSRQHSSFCSLYFFKHIYVFPEIWIPCMYTIF